MASLTRHTLTLVSLFFFVLLLLCSEATRPPSNSPYPTPAPTPTPAPALTTSTTPTPAPTPTPTPTPTPAPTPTTATPAPAGGPATDDSDSPISLKELLELALPEIGVQRKVDAGSVTTEGSKVASKQLQAVEHKINEFKAVLKKRLADPKTSEPIRECLSQCQDNFEDAIDGVKSSIESIDKKNLPKANVDVSAVSTDVDTCNDCFIEMIGEDKEIKAFDDWVRGVTGDCLINLQKH